ncbi:MAG: gamma carbonic anhydrase family protein [Caldilineales bacterium]|nr:gamma carbonic anhydrase family protein [Caldilineales bacterium]
MDVIGHQPHLIDPSVFIAPNATIVGHVIIAAEASVWFGAVLRGDVERIEIGRGSNIQDNVVIHADPGYPTLIGENVTVGHGAVVHGCVIEDGALIGMNATILNGAHIGAEAVIGAGAVVPPGAHIPPASLAVGIPARTVRTLDEEERSAGARGAAIYQARSRQYRQYYQSRSETKATDSTQTEG